MNMRKLESWTRIVAVVIHLLVAGRATQGAEPPVPIIFDSDVDQDCDDIGALFMLHGTVERGEAKLLATIGCTSSDAIAPCLDAINTWFGRPEIPVGTLKDKGLLDHQGFAVEIAKRYPKKSVSGNDYPDAVKLYRKILASQPDKSVVVLAVGPLRNLANLLRSPADDVSPLDGVKLVARKVKRLDVMGGVYPPSNAKEAEWNFKQDPASAALVCSAWPTPILFNGEGGSTNSGRRVTYEMPEHNPLTMAYRLYPGVGFAGDRLSWDPISVLVAVRGAEPWYETVTGGKNVTDPSTGFNVWRSVADGQHAYLVLKSSKGKVEQTLEDMQTAGKARPTNLHFNTLYYSDVGMCRVTQSGDRSKEGVWRDKATSSWMQFEHVDGRKRLVTSYLLECRNKYLLPSAIELEGSNDGGESWTALDKQTALGFDETTTRREFTVPSPAKWNLYRLRVMPENETEGIQVDTIELNEHVHCEQGTSVATLKLDQPAITLPVHGRVTLNATVTPINTFERQVAWNSSNPQIAEVRLIGEQTAVVIGKRPGECLVTAMIDGVTQAGRVTVNASTLPMGWQYDELNTPPIPGAVEAINNRFTLTGSGHAMTSWWERVRDQGVFVSHAVNRDLSLSARLTSLAPSVGGPSYQWDSRPPTVSGIMVRESLTESAGRFVLVQLSASGELTCRWREKSGDQDDNQSKVLGTVELPCHLKIERSSEQVRVYASADGKEWGKPLMSHKVRFDNSSRIGLFVCSGNTFASATAAFDSVELSE
jgi:hypothetical protein